VLRFKPRRKPSRRHRVASDTAKYEQYECPEEFQDRLNEIGGFSRYDTPNFRLVWGQGGQEECLYRAGGAWHVEGLPSFVGYRDLLVGSGVPCWCLLQWQSPEEYSTPEGYYLTNYDDETGLQTLGEFPYTGRYRLLYSLRWTEKRGNALHFEAMPLSSLLLRTIVPIIMDAKDISREKTMATLKELEEREKATDLAQIEDRMRSNALPFHGNAVSYGKQGCRTSLVDKRIEQMTRNWGRMMTNVKALGRGLSSYSENPTV
jgi:hypothetical protein